MANRANARVDVVHMGASLVEAQPTTSSSKWTSQALAGLLRARYPTPGVVGGRGFIGTPTTFVAANWPIAFTGGAFDDTALSLGAKHRVWQAVAAAKAVLTVPPAGLTSYDIQYLAGPSGQATTAYWKNDAGAATVFSTNNAAITSSKLHVPGPVANTVEVGWNAAGALVVDGIIEYNGDENAGIQVHNCGHGFFTTAQWQTGNTWTACLAALTPKLLIMQDYGANDGYTGNGNIGAAQFQANLTALIAQVRAAGITCPIVLVSVYDLTQVALPTKEPWANYVAAQAAIAAADPTIVYVDLTTKMPATNAAKTFNLYDVDGIHGNANGNAYHYIAQILFDTITTPSTGF
jgi:hypothetical protein